jgi:hypothetical protein
LPEISIAAFTLNIKFYFVLIATEQVEQVLEANPSAGVIPDKVEGSSMHVTVTVTADAAVIVV